MRASPHARFQKVEILLLNDIRVLRDMAHTLTLTPDSGFSPPDRKGLLDFMLESGFAMLLHHAATQYPARAAPSASRRVSRQSGSPVDPAEYPTKAAQWIPPSIPPEQYSARAAGQASGVPPSCSLVDLAEYPARAARQFIPPSIPPERLACGSRRVHQSSPPMNPAKYRAEWFCQSSCLIPPSIPPDQPASGPHRVFPEACQSIPPSILPDKPERLASPVDPASIPPGHWIPPSIPPEQLASGSRPVSRQSCSPVGPAEYPARAAHQSIPPRILPERSTRLKRISC